MRNRSRFVASLSLALATPLFGAAGLPSPGGAGGDVAATVTDLRSGKGVVLACLTTRPDAFPECTNDPAAKTVKAPAGENVELDFGRVPAGRYAIALFHDENDNGRLDKRLMLPREGYGFSRNAPVRMGPPPFSSAAFAVDGEDHHETIRMRYLL